MNATEPENPTYRCLDRFYQRRIYELRKLRLTDILAKVNVILPWTMGSGTASHIVEALLQAAMLASDETAFRDAVLKPIARLSGEVEDNPGFYPKLIRLTQEYPATYRIQFEQEWANAVNRFEREFLNEFATEKGEIDWEKLVRFNSGK